MNRLPFELLNQIVYFIEAESSLPTRRAALASLSRTNKTFHNIATSSLYLHAVLTSENRVGQWGNFYASKLNPWNLKNAMDELKDLVVPSTITFIPSQDLNLDHPTQPIFPRERPSFGPLLAVSTPFTSFFFRNLTSFVVSTGFTLDPKFIATLYAPTQPTRINLVNFGLSGGDLESAVVFILGAFNEFEFCWDTDLFDWGTFHAREAEKVVYWERYWDPGEEAGEEPDWLWDDISVDEEYRRLVSKGQIDYDTFSQLSEFELGPRDPDYIRNHVPKLYPFSNLESFTLMNPNSQHLNLLFTDPSQCPCLVYLTLRGSFDGVNDEGENEIDNRLLSWRIATTQLNGSFVLPFDITSLAHFWDNNRELVDLGPVPGWISDDYAGLNLHTFDLSELRIV